MTLNIAHRGARSIAPENTIIAAKKGYDCSAHLWETDIAVTRDEHLILFHDPVLDRTTDVAAVFPDRQSTAVIDYTLDEIRQLHPGERFIESDPFSEIRNNHLSRHDLAEIQDAVIPTLEEALSFTKELNWKINLEMKVLPNSLKRFPLPRRIVEIIRRIGVPPSSVIISSFYHPWLVEMASLEPEFEIQALIGNDDEAALDWGDYRFETYNANASMIDEAQISRAKANGKAINLFTVNARHEMIRFINAGVDGLITDYPQDLAVLLSETGQTPPKG